MAVIVLVVDDDPDARYIVSQFIRSQQGVDAVLHAADGVEAIEIMRRESPRVVITDLMMPRLDGLQTTRLIREEWPDTRIVVITSLGDNSYEQDAYAYGADAFLDKSRLLDELLPTLRRLLS